MYRVKGLQQKYGDLHRVIPRLVNEGGQLKAAKVLGLSPATINKWLKDNGYQKRIQYIHVESEEKAS